MSNTTPLSGEAGEAPEAHSLETAAVVVPLYDIQTPPMFNGATGEKSVPFTRLESEFVEPETGQRRADQIEFTPNLQFYLAVLGGVAVAFDYSVVLVSIQGYWQVVAPDRPGLYGFAFGCYDLMQFFFAPIVGYLSDKVGIKLCFVVCLLINVVGNVIYSLGIFAGGLSEDEAYTSLGQWWFLILGRMVAGIGSGCITLTVVYVTKVSTVEQRSSAVGKIRIPQTLARQFGPVIAIFICFLFPTHIDTTSTVSLIFNFFTIPGWLAVVVSFCSCLTVAIFFDNPHPAEFSKVSEFEGKFNIGEGKDIIFHTGVLSMVTLVSGYVYYTILALLFTIGVGRYQLVDTGFDLYLLFLPFGIGAAIGTVAWRRMNKSNVAPEKRIFFCNIAATASLLLLTFCTADWAFFGAIGLMGATTPITFSASEVIFSLIFSRYKEQAQGRDGLFPGIMSSAGALSRFIGPFISGYVMQVQQSSSAEITEILGTSIDPETAYGPDGKEYLINLLGNATAAGYDTEELCVLTYPNYYYVDGCEVTDYTGYMLLLVVLIATVALFNRLYYYKRFSSLWSVHT